MTSKNVADYGSTKTNDIDLNDIDSNDIDIALVLGDLIYTLGQMRAVAVNCTYNGSLDCNETKEDLQRRQLLLSGKIDFYAAFPKNCDQAAYPLGPTDIRHILASRPLLFNGITSSEFVMKNLADLEVLSKKKEIFINNFDAVNNDTEVVYAIAALTAKELQQPSQISVIIRGSSNTSDWQQNVKGLFPIKLKIEFGTTKRGVETAHFMEDSMEEKDTIKIPANVALLKKLKKEMGKDPILVHRGFFRYLFDNNDCKKSKYGLIVKKLGSLMGNYQFNAKSELTITGHSLGAALATLLSFFLACNNTIIDNLRFKKENRQYVSCISFAAPAVGNGGFQKAFRFLEQENNLRHVRVTNQCDLVPLLPTMLSLHACRHTGVQVHLRGKDWPLGRQQDVLVRDTSKTSPFDVLFQCIGCFVTTLPCLIPSLPVIVGLGVCYLFRPQGKKSPGDKPPTSPKEKSKEVSGVFTIGVPVFFTCLLVNDVFRLSVLETFGEIIGHTIRQLHDVLLSFGDILNEVQGLKPIITFLSFGWNTWLFLQFNKYLWFWQLIMLARQSQHILGLWSDYGITHSLQFYKHNADEYRRKLKDIMLGLSREKLKDETESEYEKRTDDELREKLRSKNELWKDLRSSSLLWLEGSRGRTKS